MAKKKQTSSFTSIRILSNKAQALWTKAMNKIEKAKSQQNGNGTTVETFITKDEVVPVTISMYTIALATLTIIGVVLAAWLVFALRGTLLVLILSAFLAIAIDSSVTVLERLRIPRSIAVLLIYIAFLAIATFLIASLIPIVAVQVQEFARFMNRGVDTFLASNLQISIPFLAEETNNWLTQTAQDLARDLDLKNQASALFQLGQNLSSAAQTWFAFGVSIAGSVVNFIGSFTLILILAFFMQMEKESLIGAVRLLLPLRYRGYYDVKSEAIHLKIAQWFQGQLVLCLTIGILVFIALLVLGMPYALTLALLAGFTEFIPVVGPLLAAIPAILIALTQEGLLWAVVIAAVYYVIQVCENNLLVPLIMKQAVGLSPIIILVGMMVGVSFPDTVHPILGIILAVPVAAIVTIFINDLREAQKKK